MTSPVERISGPSRVSTPWKRANGKTASLTSDVIEFLQLHIKLGELFARHDARSNLGDWLADSLGDERHGPGGTRIDFDDIDVIFFDRILHIHQATDIQGQRHFFGLADQFFLNFVG